LRVFAVYKKNRNSYFSYLFFVDDKALITRDELCKVLCEGGIPARRGNLYDVLYKLNIFRSALPKYIQKLAHPDYMEVFCSNAEKANACMIRIEMLEIFGGREARAFTKIIKNLSKL